MKARIFATGISAAIALAAPTAFADHNSVHGEGWANMPNDIHNTRVETLQENDSESFRDFVKNGAGSESVNRFESEETTAKQEKAQSGKAETAQTQSQSMSGTRANTEVRDQKQSRPDRADRSSTRQRPAVDRSNRTRSDRARRSGTRSGGKRSKG